VLLRGPAVFVGSTAAAAADVALARLFRTIDVTVNVVLKSPDAALRRRIARCMPMLLVLTLTGYVHVLARF